MSRQCVNNAMVVLTSVLDTQPGQPKFRACVPCKETKTRCSFAAGAAICQRCQTRGLDNDCIILPRKARTRSNSAPPSECVEDQTRSSNPCQPYLVSKPTARRKRSHSESSQHRQVNQPKKQPHLVSQQHVTLDLIVEVDDETESGTDTLDSGFGSMAAPVYSMLMNGPDEYETRSQMSEADINIWCRVHCKSYNCCSMHGDIARVTITIDGECVLLES